MERKKVCEKFQNIRITKRGLAWVCMTGVFLLACVFMATHIDKLLDSDTSTVLVFSRRLAREKRILTDSWYYATEIRILNTQLSFIPLFYIFEDWHIIRTVGSIITYIIMLCSFGYFCKQAKLSKYFPLLSVILMLPFSWNYMEFVIKGLQYIPYTVISFAFFALNFQAVKYKDNKKRVLCCVIMFILALLSGLAGARQLLVLFIPLLLSAFVVYVLKKNLNTAVFLANSCIGFVGSAIGYVVNMKVLANIFDFQNWGGIRYITPSWENIWNVLTGLLTFYGYKEGSLFSSATIYNLFSGLFILLIAFSIFACVRKELSDRENDTYEDLEIVLFYLAAIIVFTLFYAATDMSYVNRYNIPIAVFGIPIIGIGLKDIKWDVKIKNAAFALFFILLLLCGAGTYKTYSKIDNTADLREIAAFLTENDYYEGYSTFWNGNVLTELSDGEIDMRVWSTVNVNAQNINNIYRWAQLKEHETTVPEGKVFVLFSESQYEETTLNQYLEEEDIIYQKDGGYIIFGYDSYDEFVSCLPIE